MKTLLLSGLALAAAVSARAEFYRPGFRDHGRRGWTTVEVGLGAPYGYGCGYGPGYCSTLSNYDTYGGYRSGTANGFLLGALAGAVIGNNSGSLHHSAGRGAVLGAGVGMLLGAIADANRPAEPVPAQSAYVVAAPQALAPAQYQSVTTTSSAPALITPVAAAPAAPATPLSGANALFGR